jgi:hypothetical protein
MRNPIRPVAGLLCAGFCFGIANLTSAQMAVDSLSGALTANEITSFKNYMAGTTIAVNNAGNAWLFGSTGHECAALGQMYEATGDLAILDRMIQYTDTALAGRNDPVTGVLMWTGKRELCWPNSFTEPVYTSCESGEVAGHILLCARLILQTPSIWNTTVGVGDPNGYGTTYKARAQKYLTECDKTIDTFIIPIWVSAANANHIYAPTDWNGDGGANGGPVAWNRISMFLAALQRSAECHEILADNPSRVTQLDGIVQSNVQWFLSKAVPYTSSSGYSCYNWYYRADTTTKKEEVWEAHGALDVRMLWESYRRGIGLSKAEMTKFANTIQYSVWTGSYFHGLFDGTDGTFGTKTYTKGEYIDLAEFVPAIYTTVGTADESHTTDPSMIGPILWMKNRVYQQFAVASLSASKTVAPGTSTTDTVTVDPMGGFSGTVALTASGLPSGASASFSPSSIAGASGTSTLTLTTSASTPAGNSTVTITGTSGTKTHTDTLLLTVTQSTTPLTGTATASTTWSSSYDASKAIDGSDSTRWSAASGQTTNQWLRIDFGSTKSYSRVVIKEISYQRVTSFKLQSSTDGTTFTDISGASGTTIGAAKTITFAAKSARYIRLYISSASDVPTINEFQVYSN